MPTTVSFSWTFSLYCVDKNTYCESARFGAPNSPTSFYLRLTNQADLSLHLATCPQKKLHINKFDVLARKESTEETITLSASGDISLDDVFLAFQLNETKTNWDVECTITYEEPRPSIEVDHCQLLRDQLVKYGQREARDFNLVTDDGRIHPVHKDILAIRSPVWAQMFSHDGVVENRENQMNIVGVSSGAVEAFLDYIYSCDTSMVGQFAAELFVIGTMYDIQPLVQACIKAITVDNVAQLYYLADLHQQEDFKQKMMLFISENKKAVKRSAGWNEFIKPNIELFDQLIDFVWLSNSSSKSSK